MGSKNLPPPRLLFCFLYFVLHPFVCMYRLSCILRLLTTHKTNIHAPGMFRTRNPSKLCDLTPRGHRDRRIRSPNRPSRPYCVNRMKHKYTEETKCSRLYSWVKSHRAVARCYLLNKDVCFSEIYHQQVPVANSAVPPQSSDCHVGITDHKNKHSYIKHWLHCNSRDYRVWSILKRSPTLIRS